MNDGYYEDHLFSGSWQITLKKKKQSVKQKHWSLSSWDLYHLQSGSEKAPLKGSGAASASTPD